MNKTEAIRESKSYKVLLSLYEQAFKKAPFDALYTVLRVSGIEGANWDPFEESRNAFSDYNWLQKKLPRKGQQLVQIEWPINVLSSSGNDSTT